MSAEIIDTADDLLTLKVSGKLRQAELRQVQQAAAKTLEQRDTIRILVIAENFEGFERSDDWTDISFQVKYDRSIERLAIVGEKKWEDLVFLFVAKGLRRFPIEYFTPGELQKAKDWLRQQA